MASPLRIRYPDSDALRIYVNPTQEKRARALIEMFPQILTKGYKRGSLKFAENLQKIIKRAMRTHKPPKGSGVSWPALSESTLRRWGEHGIYVLTEQYLRSIKLITSRDGKRVSVELPNQVAKRSPKDRNKGLTLNQVAKILELGTQDYHIPARPLWRPSFDAAGGKEKLTKTIVREIQAEVRRYR